jgi:hypothetical protein
MIRPENVSACLSPKYIAPCSIFILKSFFAHSIGMVLITSYMIVNSYINVSAGGYICSIKKGGRGAWEFDGDQKGASWYKIREPLVLWLW